MAMRSGETHFGSYLSQILMDFASIWVILKAESCWAALILYRIGTTNTNTIQIKIQNGSYLLVRGDTRDDTSQPCRGGKGVSNTLILWTNSTYREV